MGDEVNLTKAPNGAIARAEVLETAATILYLEPTTEKLADGVWCTLEDEFVKGLSAAAIYFIRNGDLYIDLKYDTGTMRFSKQNES